MEMKALVVLLVAVLIGAASGQNYQPPRCLSFADECRPFVNGWYLQPSRACCNQVEMTINNDFRCFCTLYNENRWSYWFEINYVKTLQLPAICGLYFNLRDCPSQWGSGFQQPPPTPWGFGFGAGSPQNSPPNPFGGFASPPSAFPPTIGSAPSPIAEAPASLSPGSLPSPSPASAPASAPL